MLPDLGTVVYNGYQLPAYRETISFQFEGERSGDNRTTTANRYRAAWRFIVTSSNSASHADTINALRDTLSRPGGRFIMTGTGLGDFDLNASLQSGALDYGPWTKVSMKQLGSIATEITFEVSFLYSDCREASTNQIMELSWTMDFRTGLNRMGERVVKGYFVVGAHKHPVSSRRVEVSADDFYDSVIPPVALGWERASEQRSLSSDRRRCDFAYTDRQLLRPRPPGVIEYTFDHSEESLDKAAATWGGVMSGHYVMAPNAPPNLALGYFIDAVRDRRDYINKNSLEPMIPLKFSMRSSDHNNTSEFTFHFSTTNTAADILAKSLWRPLPGHDNARFAQSMSVAWAAGGFDTGRLRPGDDLIIDLCSGTKPRIPLGAPQGPRPMQADLRGLTFQCPSPDVSWQRYDVAVMIEIDDGMVTHRPLPTKPTKTPGPKSTSEQLAGVLGGSQTGTKITDMMTKAAEDAANAVKNKAVRLQQQRPPVIYLTLIGEAVRACYGIPMPSLISAAGSPAVLANRPGSEYWLMSTVNTGLLMYVATFRLRWILTGPVNSPLPPAETSTTPQKPIDLLGLAGAIGGGIVR